MLIVIKSIGLVAETEPQSPERLTFYKLINSAIEQKHAVIVDDEPESYRISDFHDLGDFVINRLVNISQMYNENEAMKALVERYLVVDFSVDPSFIELDRDSNIIVGYDRLRDSRFFEVTTLILEDLNDKAVYFSFIDYYCHSKGLGNYNIQFDFRAGGGSSCKRNFKDSISEGKLTVCILDSDKKHPSGPNGSTAKAFNDVLKEEQEFWHVEILPYHEAENILPIYIYEKAYSFLKEKERVKLLQRTKRVLSRHPASILYFDFKNGLSAYQYSELDQKYGKFWGNVITSKFINDSCRDCIVDGSSFQKVEKGRYHCSKKQHCLLLGSICKDAASALKVIREENESINYLLNNSIKEAPRQIEEIMRIGRILFSWGFADEFQTAS